MRIKSVTISKLFGIFNHPISMNLDDRITIIHALNGFGKTTILSLLNNLFNNRFSYIQSIPFSMFEVEFDNGSILKMRRPVRRSGEHAEDYLDVTLHSKDKQQLQEAKIRGVDVRQLHLPLGMIDEVIPSLVRISEEGWRNIETGEDLTLADVVGRYGDLLPGDAKKQVVPDWLREITGALKIRFIESQRLLKLGKRTRRPEGRWAQASGYEPAVAFYAEQIAKEISRKLTEYAELSQSLDQTFPMRLVQHLETGNTREVSVAEVEQA